MKRQRGSGRADETKREVSPGEGRLFVELRRGCKKEVKELPTAEKRAAKHERTRTKQGAIGHAAEGLRGQGQERIYTRRWAAQMRRR